VKVLLDESLPRGLKRLLAKHDVRTVVEQGWRSTRNSTLLELAQDSFAVLVTADQGFEHEQNLENFDIGVVILVAPTNRLADYELNVLALDRAIEVVEPGQTVRVAAEQAD
jgi:predicted nuclease of predicted toxin-antitoxin system